MELPKDEYDEVEVEYETGAEANRGKAYPPGLLYPRGLSEVALRMEKGWIMRGASRLQSEGATMPQPTNKNQPTVDIKNCGLAAVKFLLLLNIHIL